MKLPIIATVKDAAELVERAREANDLDKAIRRLHAAPDFNPAHIGHSVQMTCSNDNYAKNLHEALKAIPRRQMIAWLTELRTLRARYHTEEQP